MTSADEPRVKIQAWLNLDTYEGWAVRRLLGKRWKVHDLCRTIVREWLDFKHADLERNYGISRAAWEREVGGNVRSLAKG